MALSIVMATMGVILTIGIFSLNGMGGQISGMRGELKDLGARTNGEIKDLSVRIGSMGVRIDGLRGDIKNLGVRMDGLSRQLSEEFRAMRAETAAQTSAIANSITAARQFQPQVIVVPPAPEPQQVPNSRH
jgi:hypothetical protein